MSSAIPLKIFFIISLGGCEAHAGHAMPYITTGFSVRISGLRAALKLAY